MSITLHPHQDPADLAVVIPTILRPSLLRAARSVFRQDFDGRIHLLIGIDMPAGDAGVLDQLQQECPPHVMLTVLDLGYSTSVRHGGLAPNAFGGALRTILSQAANSRWVAYLDDNDWYAPMHLRLLRGAIEGRDWAFSHRWLIDPHTGWPICQDDWDSVGPDAGINQATFGGFCQPSTLLLDRAPCGPVLPLWSGALTPSGEGEDRLVFAALRDRAHGSVKLATCFCLLNTDSVDHPHHREQFTARGLHWIENRSLVPRLEQHLHAALTTNDPAAARIEAEAALAINPYHPGALSALAYALDAAGDAENAALRHAQAGLLDFAAV